MTTFREWQAMALSPAWLRRKNGTTLEQGFGRAKDDDVDRANAGTKARFPDFAPADALQHCGKDRSLDRYVADSDASYRSRLRAAFAVWEWAGTATGIISGLTAAGFGNVKLFNVFAPSGPGGATPWPPDSDPANWSRFWVELRAPFPWDWQLRHWGDGHTWGEIGPDGTPYTWGSTATVGQVALTRQVIAKWKSAHEICAAIWVKIGTTYLYWTGVG